MSIESRGEKVFNVINKLFMVLLNALMIYPFIYVLAISLNDAVDAERGGIYFWPRKFTLASYRMVFVDKAILNAAGISASRVILGTFLVLFFSAMFAYVFTQPDFILYKQLKFFFFLAMFFGGGSLIPIYMLYRNLHILNTYWVYILPGLVSLGYTIWFRTFFQGLPKGLEEAAKIDGANDLTVLFRILLPLSKPMIATLALFSAVGIWGSWVDNLYFVFNPKLKTLQFVLMEVITRGTVPDDIKTLEEYMEKTVTPYTLRMAMTIVVTFPILCVYPFLQKYFVKGFVIGSMKG